MFKEQDFVCIKEFFTKIRAEVCKNFLINEGINCYLSSLDIGGTYSSLNNFLGIRLMVEKKKERPAQEFLKKYFS